MKVQIAGSTVVALLAGAAFIPSSALAGPKTDTIKSADFPGNGFYVGDTIRATFTMNGGGSAAYDRTAVAVEGPNHGPIQVTFEKPPSAANIQYVNVRTGVMMNAVFAASDGGNGHINIVDLLRVGDRMPIFATAAGSLSTWTAVDLFVYDPSIDYHQSFEFVDGVSSMLQGTYVYDHGALFTGTAMVGAFNEVGLVPTPGSIALMGAGALLTARRRRR